MEMEKSAFNPTTTPNRQKSGDVPFLLLLTLAFVLASGFLFFTNNHFSYRCHADEPGKVRQIQSGERNYHHPMLLLNTAQVAFAWSKLEPTPQKIVWVGRTVTALFSLITILAFSYAAFLSAGRVAAILCGVFMLGSPLVLEASHYFKEDPAMLMGIGVSFLAITLYQRKPELGTLLGLGVGAALACSGKHLGVAILPFCIYTIYKHGKGTRHLLLFLATTLFLFALINYQAVIHAAGFLGGIDREVAAIKRGGAVPVENPSPFTPFRKYTSLLRENLPFPLFWFIGFGIYAWGRQRPKKTPFGQVLLLALLVFLTLVCIPKTAARYLLPVVCLLCFVAAVGATRLLAIPNRTWKIAGFALPLVVGLGIETIHAFQVYQSFKKDSRLEAVQWIAHEIPADAVIAQDTDGLLEGVSNVASDSPYKVRQSLYDAGIDITSCSIEALRANRVRYFLVIGNKPSSSRKKKAATKPQTGTPLSSQMSKCRKVWECQNKYTTIINVSPLVSIYELPGTEVP